MHGNGPTGLTLNRAGALDREVIIKRRNVDTKITTPPPPTQKKLEKELCTPAIFPLIFHELKAVSCFTRYKKKNFVIFFLRERNNWAS